MQHNKKRLKNIIFPSKNWLKKLFFSPSFLLIFSIINLLFNFIFITKFNIYYYHFFLFININKFFFLLKSNNMFLSIIFIKKIIIFLNPKIKKKNKKKKHIYTPKKIKINATYCLLHETLQNRRGNSRHPKENH